MSGVTIPQSKIDQLLAYRKERIALLSQTTGESSKKLLEMEINTLEVALITLGIEFDK